MRRVFVALALVGLLLMLITTPSFGAPQDAKPQTVISFTFDGGFKSQMDAARILERHNLVGTFYVNTGYIGYPAYLTLDQLRELARGRHEIGSGSVHNLDLAKIETPQATTEICNDRATLDRLGFQVTSFAYPYGDETRRIRELVQKCGFNSARDVSGLNVSQTECQECPLAEDIPPADDWHIRTDTTSVNMTWLTDKIMRIEDGGGGWLPLVFSDICTCPSKGSQAITPEDFAALVDWVIKRPTTTRVMTVDQVVRGDYRKVIGTPIERLVPKEDNADPKGAGDVALSQVPAVTVGGIAIGQAQVLATVSLVALAGILGYRLGGRKNRYVDTHETEHEYVDV
jgi:hypothetical protein